VRCLDHWLHMKPSCCFPAPPWGQCVETRNVHQQPSHSRLSPQVLCFYGRCATTCCMECSYAVSLTCETPRAACGRGPCTSIPELRPTADTCETTVYAKPTFLCSLFPRINLFDVLVRVCHTEYRSVISSLMVDILPARHAVFLRGSSRRFGRRVRTIYLTAVIDAFLLSVMLRSRCR